jgi:hypothetical protein
MQLSRETLTIFKNFSNINSNLTIKPGNKLATIAAGKNIIAEATVAEHFPVEFGIYDLSEFLGALSLFDSPDLEFADKYVNIQEGKNGIRYFAANQSVLTAVPTLKQFPDPDIEFDLPGSMLSQIQRVASILHVSDFSLVGDGSTMTISVGDKTSATSNTFTSDVGPTDKTFRVNFKAENLKLLPGDYNVAIGAKKIARFKAKNQDLTYLIATELDSTYDF